MRRVDESVDPNILYHLKHLAKHLAKNRDRACIISLTPCLGRIHDNCEPFRCLGDGEYFHSAVVSPLIEGVISRWGSALRRKTPLRQEPGA